MVANVCYSHGLPEWWSKHIVDHFTFKRSYFSAARILQNIFWRLNYFWTGIFSLQFIFSFTVCLILLVSFAASLFSFGIFIYSKWYWWVAFLIKRFQYFYLQDWFAFRGNASELNFTLVGEAFFPNTGNPTADDNYGFCQVSGLIWLACISHLIVVFLFRL